MSLRIQCPSGLYVNCEGDKQGLIMGAIWEISLRKNRLHVPVRFVRDNCLSK